jgi:hypothetical protein
MKISDESKRRKRILVVTSSVLLIIFAFIIWFYIIPIISPPPIPVEEVLIDRFGTREIYPTVQGGREWFMNMQDPFEDEIVSSNSGTILDQQSDGSWRVNSSQVRIRIETAPGQVEWRNVEMTGYVRMISPILATGPSEPSGQDKGSEEEEDSLDPHITWRAKGGRHNDMVPCEGTALNGGLYIDGKVAWKKEIWHTGGYTDARGISHIPTSLINKWIGWKTAMYNINNNSAVKMESYLDINADNNWIKVSEVEDNGGWYADTSDEIFYSADCDRKKDYIITNSGPIATFRADNLVFDFKNFSIREIIPNPVML